MKIKTLIEKLGKEKLGLDVEVLICKKSGEIVVMELTKKTATEARDLLKMIDAKEEEAS